MSINYYGLSCDPFLKQPAQPVAPYISNDIRIMQDRLQYLSTIRGIGVFTAPPGMGKTYALKEFQNRLNQNLFQVVYLSLTTISIAEFYRQLCHALKLEASFHKATMFRDVHDYIYYLYKDKKQPLILILDEAQHLKPEVLNDLKILMNFEYDSLSCFTLILSGEPRLLTNLSRAANEALRQRITVHYEFQGLSDGEIRDYISHKLRSVGGSDTIITPDAITAIHGACYGNPRLIDNLMSIALLIGEQKKEPVINAEIIMQAVNEISLL